MKKVLRVRAGRLTYRGSISGKSKELYLFPYVKIGTGIHSASYSVGKQVSFSAVKRPACETDHSFPFSAEVRNECSHYSTPLPVFRVHTKVTSLLRMQK